MPARKVKRRQVFDRRRFAVLVASGTSATEAARAVGSKATDAAAIGCRMLAEPAVARMVTEEREALLTAVRGDISLARARAVQVLRDPKCRALWHRAWDFLAKLTGAYAPERHQLEVRTVSDLVRRVIERKAGEPVNRVAEHLGETPALANGNGNGNGHAAAPHA